MDIDYKYIITYWKKHMSTSWSFIANRKFGKKEGFYNPGFGTPKLTHYKTAMFGFIVLIHRKLR